MARSTRKTKGTGGRPNGIESTPLLLGRHHRNSAHDQPIASEDGQSQFLDRSLDGVAALGGRSHLITIAPVAATRSRSCLIPNLLTYKGSVVVVDLTGDAYAATARARRDMGQTVIRLDPFRVVDAEPDALNPLDLLSDLGGAARESTCQDVAALMPGFHSFTDPWENQAFGLLSGVIGYLSTVPEKNKLSDLYPTFHSDDVVYNLAVVLDTIGGKIPKMAYCEIASFLQGADSERSRVLAAVTSQLKAMGSQEAQMAFGTSTLPLTAIRDGAPVSIYLMMPPAKMPSHFSLLRIWLGALLHCAMDRRFTAAEPMLFMLDECAKLGPFIQLQAAITSARPNFRIWTLWQEFQQLRSVYPGSWLIDNCGALQVFGSRDVVAAGELATLLGVGATEIQSLGADEQIVWRNGISERIRQLDYSSDPLFAGRFD